MAPHDYNLIIHTIHIFFRRPLGCNESSGNTLHHGLMSASSKGLDMAEDVGHAYGQSSPRSSGKQ